MPHRKQRAEAGSQDLDGNKRTTLDSEDDARTLALQELDLRERARDDADHDVHNRLDLHHDVGVNGDGAYSHKFKLAAGCLVHLGLLRRTELAARRPELNLQIRDNGRDRAVGGVTRDEARGRCGRRGKDTGKESDEGECREETHCE